MAAPSDRLRSDGQPASSLWRHRDFMRLWSAETVSQLGSQVTLLALPLTAIVLLRASAFQIGLLGTIEFLPFILIGPIPIGSLVGGALGDAIGLRATLWIGALGGLTAVLPVLFSRVRTLRSVPEDESELSAVELQLDTRSASLTTDR